MKCSCKCVFFFQAEDGIRDLTVTGVQTCALPIYHARHPHRLSVFRCGLGPQSDGPILRGTQPPLGARSIDGDFRERFGPRRAQARFWGPGIPMTEAAVYSLVAGIFV